MIKLIIFLLSLNLINGFKINFINNCNYPVHVYNNSNTCDLQSKQNGCIVEVNQPGWLSMFRNGFNPNNNIFEISYGLDNQIYYDISIIPPGCTRDRLSFCACYKQTGIYAFTTPMTVIPSNINNHRCKKLICIDKPTCKQYAYTYPNQDIRTFTCSNITDFIIQFC